MSKFASIKAAVVYRKYARYALSALATVGFGSGLN